MICSRNSYNGALRSLVLWWTARGRVQGISVQADFFAEFPRDWEKTTRRNRLLWVLQIIIYKCSEKEIEFIASQLLIWFSWPSWSEMTMVMEALPRERASLSEMNMLEIWLFPLLNIFFLEYSLKHLILLGKQVQIHIFLVESRSYRCFSNLCKLGVSWWFPNSINQILGSWVYYEMT